MCLQCHSKLSNQHMLKDLQQIMKNPKFDEWNSTSLSHLQLACAGANGHDCRNLAILILTNFLKWYKSKKLDCYFPRCGLERMPPKKEIQDILNWMNSNEYHQNHLQRVIDTFPQIPEDICLKWTSFRMERIPEKSKNYLFMGMTIVALVSFAILMIRS